MGDPAHKIVVRIVDAHDNSITPQPLTVTPPAETDKLINRLQGGHGAGVLLRGHNDLVMDNMLEQPGHYTYRVTEAAKTEAGAASNSTFTADTTVDFLKTILPTIPPMRQPWSKEQLASLCQGLHKADGSPVQLPVWRFAYNKLTQDNIAWEKWLLPVDHTAGRHPWELAQLVTQVLVRRVSAFGSELEMSGLIDTMVYDVMKLATTKLNGITMKRNRDRDRVEPSLTQSSMRPDFWLQASGTMLIKGEDKTSTHQLLAARSDLLKKMSDWSVAYHGSVPYLPCYAAAGVHLQFCVIPRELNTLYDLTEVLDVSKEMDRLLVIHVALVLYCAISSLAKELPSKYKEVGVITPRAHGTRITLWGTTVQKQVNLAENAMLSVIHQRMGKVYQVHCEQLVKAHEGYPKVKGRTYEVWLKPQGTSVTLDTLLLQQLKPAMRCTLQALAALHDAGFGHGDVRWDNLVYLYHDTFVLIDLESTVDLANLEEQQHLLHCGLRPVAWGDNLEAWEDAQADASGQVVKRFTQKSDLYMFGRLLEE